MPKIQKYDNSFTKEMKKYDTSWMWILYVVSLVSLVLVFWNLLEEGLKYQILYFGTIIFFFLFLLPILALNFKRRALYDPKLNSIKIQSVQGMKQYLDKIFTVEFDSPSMRGMYLQSIESRQEDKIFVYLYPSDIEISYWSKMIKELMGDDRVIAVTFVTDRESGIVGIKFWSLRSSPGKVIYPELKFNS
jgi:hypothetical protein